MLLDAHFSSVHFMQYNVNAFNALFILIISLFLNDLIQVFQTLHFEWIILWLIKQSIYTEMHILDLNFQLHGFSNILILN